MYTSLAYLSLSILLSIILALGVSRFLYPWPWKKNRLPLLVGWLLFSLRFLALFLLFLILFNPGIRQKKVETKLPALAILMDNSQSMTYLNDSLELKQFERKLIAAKEQLSDRYALQTYYFGHDLQINDTWNFSEPATNIGLALKQLQQTAQIPIAATLLISDGNFNRGENPAFVSRNLAFPVYALGLGDTTNKANVYLHNIYHNPVGYLDEQTPVEVDIRAVDLQRDTNISVSLMHKGKQVITEEISLNQDSRKQKFNLYFKPQKIGLQSYKVKINGSNQPVHSFYIRIREQRQKVLVLYHAVHPDIGVIRKGLEQSNRFEPVLKQATRFDGKISDYNMVVLHQVPSGNFAGDRWFAEIFEKKIPYWMILGPKSDFSTFNQGQNALNLTQLNGKFEEASARFNSAFTLFKVNQTLIENLTFLPPLTVPFAKYKVVRGVGLFMQDLHGVQTDRPAWLFTDQPYRFSILTGTGLWKWRMYLYRQTSSHSGIDDLVYKTVKFLSLNEPRKRLIVEHENLYNAAQPISIEAIWYNENYEPDNALPGHIEIQDTANNVYKFAFTPEGNRYKARPGALPAGKYRFKALFTRENESFADTGSFVVARNNIEQTSRVLNKNLLSQLAGSRYYEKNQFDMLIESLMNNPPAKTVRKTEIQLTDLIRKNIFLWIIVLLLTSEWIIRKYKGRI